MLAQFSAPFLVQLDYLRGLHGLSLVFSACAAEYLPLFLFCGTLRGRGCILRLETSCNTPDRIARLRAFLGACARCFRPRAFFCVCILSGSPLPPVVIWTGAGCSCRFSWTLPPVLPWCLSWPPAALLLSALESYGTGRPCCILDRFARPWCFPCLPV